MTIENRQQVISAGFVTNAFLAARRFDHKPTQRIFKQALPFADLVIEYFQKNPNAYLEIHCGDRAFRQAGFDANGCINNGGKPSLYVPEYDDFESYWWPVRNLPIVLRWNCSDTDTQIRFSNYLTKACKAECVWTLVKNDEYPNGLLTKFADTRRYM